MKIAIYAEKFSVAYKVAIALSGEYHTTMAGKSVVINMDNVDKFEGTVKNRTRDDGYIPIIYKGNEIRVTWGSGHMCGLKQAKDYNKAYANWRNIPKPFFPDSYEIKVAEDNKGKEDRNKKKQLNKIKKVFNWCDLIINATDNDREGELIFAYIYEYLNCKKPFKRVSLESFTGEGITTAFEDENLKSSLEVKSLEDAARARSIADWIVGANLTVATTLTKGTGKEILSVGRVQTATLNILVKRELEIKNFKPQKSYYLESTFTTSKGESYIGRMDLENFKSAKEASDKLKVLKDKQGEVTQYSVNKNKRRPPMLYNLSSLQADANKYYGMTAEDTLNIAEELKLKTYITYPRTSSAYLYDDEKDNVNEILDLLSKTDEYKGKVVDRNKRQLTSRHFNSKKITTSHYAIIPTNKIPDMKKLTDKQRKLYDLIALSIIKATYPEATVEYTNITTTVEDVDFLTTGSRIVDASWMALEPGINRVNNIPVVSKGEKVKSELKLKDSVTKAPSRYTDSSLITAMQSAGKEIEDEDLREFLSRGEDGGIGTDATRAGIIESLLKRKYAKRERKYIVPTDKGINLINVFPVDDIKEPTISAEWEKRLSDIQNNKDTLNNFIQELQHEVEKWSEEVYKMENNNANNFNMNESTGLSCPFCGGEIVEKSFGFFCSENRYQDSSSCQFMVFKPTDNFKYEPAVDIEDIMSMSGGEDSGVKTGYSKKTGKPYKFTYRPNYDKKSVDMEFVDDSIELNMECPICGEKIKKIEGESVQYPRAFCPNRHLNIFLKDSGYYVTDEDIQKMLEGEQVGPYEFKSKKGNDYRALLYLDLDEGRVQKEFV